MTTAFASAVRPGGSIVATTSSTPTTLQYTTGFGATVSQPAAHMFPNSPVVSSPLHSPNMVTLTTGPPPRLPQHPLPPTSTSISACKIEPAVEMPTRTVALKKRDVMMAKDPTLQSEMKAKEGAIIVEMAKASLQQQSQSQPEYLKPRDTFGGGAHLRGLQSKQEQTQLPSDLLIKEEARGSASSLTILPPGQVPSAAAAAYPPEHLQVLRAAHHQDLITQEINLYYQQYLKQGLPEHLALQNAQKMVEQRYANLNPDLVAARPGSVPPPMDNYRPPSRASIQPPMAHGAPSGSIAVTTGPGAQPPDAYLRQSDSPLAGAPTAAHANSRIPYSMGHPGPAGTPDHILQSYRQGASGGGGSNPPEDVYSGAPHPHRALEPSPASPSSGPLVGSAPSPVEFVLPNFESYPVVWQGHLGLKTEIATVQFHYVSGCKDLARASLPTSISDPRMQVLPTLKIGQRMRLEESQLSGVQRKMLQAQEHCILLALPCGKDTLDVEAQSRQLRSHFITYLQLKSAAGIVNVEENGAAYVVHVFPSCDFANETMSGIAPDLLARVAEIEHMVIIIATVFDNK